MELNKNQLKKVVDDRKTYIIVLVGIALGIIEGMGWITIPARVDVLLVLLGAGTLRHAISKSKKLTQELIEATEKR